MKKTIVSIVISLLFTSMVYSQPQKYKELCTPGDDYATSFRTTARGVEIWLNSSNGMKNTRSRRMVKTFCGATGNLSNETLPFPINQIEENSSKVYLDGSPTFAYCDTSYGIFVSNRPYKDQNMDNDLYEMKSSNGVWTVKRIDELNSQYWDDSPTLSKDGNLLFFATTRDNPGTGLTNVYYAIRSETGWSAPLPVADINTLNYKEEAPFLGSDGYLYFSTNRDGDLDIYRIKIDPQTGRTFPPEEPVPFPGVNQRGSDEALPTLSAGGSWLIFSSNRKDDSKKTDDYDVWKVRINQATDTIHVSSIIRTRNFNERFGEWEDIMLPCTTNLNVIDKNTGKSYRFPLNSKGEGTVIIPRSADESPCSDYRYRELIVSSELPVMEKKEFISEKDTLLIDVLAENKLTHTMYVWDKAIPEDKECVQNFPVTEVQFFLTCYWCPTTVKYADYLPCQSVLKDETCTAIEYDTPQKQCENGDIFSYQLNFKPPTVSAIRNMGSCVPTSELADESRKLAWGVEVDSSVDKFVASMKSALQRPCVQKAIRKGQAVTVEVIGWTDPRSVDGACLYTGEEINFNTSFIKLDSLWKKTAFIPNGILRKNTPFRKSGALGNELLSDVRAYYTALLLDSLWTEQVPEYRQLKQKNPPLLNVTAVGKGVKQEMKSNELRRSANVIVRTPGEVVKPDPYKEVGGRFVSLTGKPCEVLYNREVAPPSNPKIELDVRPLSQLFPKTTAPVQDLKKNEKTTLPSAVVPKPIKTKTEQVRVKPTEVVETKQQSTPASAVVVTENKQIQSPNPNLEPIKRDNTCFSVLFKELENEREANMIVETLTNAGIPNVIRTIYFKNQKQYFRIVSGCYETRELAYSAQLKSKFVIEKQNLGYKTTLLLSPDQVLNLEDESIEVGVIAYLTDEDKVYYQKTLDYISKQTTYRLSTANTRMVDNLFPKMLERPVIWYFNENMRQVAKDLSLELTAKTGIGFPFQRGDKRELLPSGAPDNFILIYLNFN